MGFNIFKQIPHIKKHLKEKGFDSEYPIAEFGKTLMILFGMKKDTATSWIKYFEENQIIELKEGMVSFNKGW